MPKVFEKTHLVGIVLFVLFLGVATVYYSQAREEALPAQETIQEVALPVEVTEEEKEENLKERLERVRHPVMCKKYGGVWNPCASACPDAGPDEMCVQVCVEKCEVPE